MRRAQRAAIAEHVRLYGWVCRQCDPHHATRDLTADHPIAMAAGGDLIQQFEVGCRPWNSAKGAR